MSLFDDWLVWKMGGQIVSLSAADIIAIVNAGGSVEIDPSGVIRITAARNPSAPRLTSVEQKARYLERNPCAIPYPPTRDWQALRRLVFERDGYVCTYCGSDGNGASLHCDHVIPVSRGGSHHPDNLTTACQSCNSSKRATPVQEWKGRKV